jgi:hypothetical protein
MMKVWQRLGDVLRILPAAELGAMSYRRTTSLQDFVAASAANRAPLQNGCVCAGRCLLPACSVGWLAGLLAGRMGIMHVLLY